MLDEFSIDDTVKVSFNLRGRKWEKDGQVSYFTNLEAWRIERLSNETTESPVPVQDESDSQDAPFPSNPPENDSGFDDLPF